MSLAFYEKAFANNYEELITYYPAFYQRVYEMQEILKTQGQLADGVENGIERAYLNNFIDYADVETIAKLETFLRLDYNKAKKLEIRRSAIKAHFMGNGKISGGVISNMIKAYVQAEVTIELKTRDNAPLPGEQCLCIQLNTDTESSIPIGDITRTLKKQVPCHLEWVLIEILLIELDLSGLEKILMRNMELHMRYPFFRNCRLDGTPLQKLLTKNLYQNIQIKNRETILLSSRGNILLNQYGMEKFVVKKFIPYMNCPFFQNYGLDKNPLQRMGGRNLYQSITACNKESIQLSNRAEIVVNHRDMERFRAKRLIQRTVFPFFQNYSQNDTPLQKGQTRNIYQGYQAENKETIGISLVKKKNLWLLNGAFSLNGSRKLNAEITEEVL